MLSYDQLRVLEWIREKERTSARVHDSDMMVGLGLTEEQAHGILLALQARGDIEFRNVALGGQEEFSFTRIHVKKSGLARLDRSDEPPASRGPMRRVIHWFTRRN